jgi:hypothetical protein
VTFIKYNLNQSRPQTQCSGTKRVGNECAIIISVAILLRKINESYRVICIFSAFIAPFLIHSDFLHEMYTACNIKVTN